MLGQWDDGSIDPETQRITLKIVGFLYDPLVLQSKTYDWLTSSANFSRALKNKVSIHRHDLY